MKETFNLALAISVESINIKPMLAAILFVVVSLWLVNPAIVSGPFRSVSDLSIMDIFRHKVEKCFMLMVCWYIVVTVLLQPISFHYTLYNFSFQILQQQLNTSRDGRMTV